MVRKLQATIVRAPAGSGKTREFVLRIALRRGLTEVYVPTLALAREWRDSIQKVNPRKRVLIMHGRDAELSVGKTYCQRSTEASMLAKAGVSVYSHLCVAPSQGQLAILPDRCQFYGSCAWIDQFNQAPEVVIYTHAHLALPRGPLERWVATLVIIDESFVLGMQETVELPLAWFRHPALPAKARQACHEVLASFQGGLPLHKAWAKKRRATRKAATALNRATPLITPSTSAAGVSRVIRNLPNMRLMAQLLIQLLKECKLREEPICAALQLTKAMQRCIKFCRRKQIERFKRRSKEIEGFVLLDATANKTVIEPFFDIAKIHNIEVERSAHVVQCYSTRCSTTSLVPAKNQEQRSRAAAQQRLLDIDALINRCAAGGKKVLVVGPASVTGNPTGNMPALLQQHPGAEFAHFNALRGIDRWKDFDTVVLVGRNQPSANDVEDIARALWYDEPAGLNLPSRFEVRRRGYRLAKGSAGVDVEVHPDPRVQAVLEQIRESESTQALDRLRLIHCKSIKQVFLLSSLPLDVTVHELRTWDELIHGSRLEQAAARAGDVLPMSGDWLATAHPDLWASETAAKVDVGRGGKREQLSNRTSFRKMFPFQVSYRLPGDRGRPRLAAAKTADLEQVRHALHAAWGRPVDQVQLLA